MARAPVMAAGGIVVQRSEGPLIAVVRLRKQNDWVLPKGKLNRGETARAAAEREVVEETGHDVSVHEFLGTLAYDVSGRPKIVHFWRMEAAAEQTRTLMADVKAVAWLPLDKAVERLSRSHEQAFLANVGPLALETGATRAASAGKSAIDRYEHEPVTGAVQVGAAPIALDAPAPILRSDTRDLAVARASPSHHPGLLRRLWGWLQREA